MRFRNSKDENHRLNQPEVRVGVCMNCIVMQQALTMANSALKGEFSDFFVNFTKISAKMRELERIERVGKGIRLGLELNDLALDAMEKNDQ